MSEPPSTIKVAALLASHDRRDRTLTCLASLHAQVTDAPFELSVVLVDDGSTDGTGSAVIERFPTTQLVCGDGTLYWAGAMAQAESVAMRASPDYLLWLNDDVVLAPDALGRLLDAAHASKPQAIAVGALADPLTGAITYSGLRGRGRHPLHVDRVHPGTSPIEVEVFNGNVVLVPGYAATRIGPIDGDFVHSAADFDYGRRATNSGIRLFLASGVVGTCERDTRNRKPWLGADVPFRQRLTLLLGPKGLPPGPRARYLRRHGGPLWLAYWLAPYFSAGASIVRASVGRTDSRG